QFQSTDLHEVETLADVFDPVAPQLGLYGAASFNGTVQGKPTDPEIAGQLSATSLTVRGTEWQSLKTSLEANSSHLDLRNAEIRPATNSGRIAFSAGLGLDH